ncbi:MAG: SprT family zinc-dependent metalloprotease [Roseateles sp.]|jgi:predicted metal-dependent hydrolase|nr:metal-dependent hydrolase [Methylibium sp.]MBY0367598.1 M48 family metallopeptidase [Burkholderiaceae bacterium]|mmetsp:Transcript_53307/g.125310  ORF Transcript_53307/g.125310 Transcript_53307/m.125310 type:complete len:270 (-) Transcript_53307:2093-2902(-)
MPARRPAPLLQDSQLSLFDAAADVAGAEPGAARAQRELWLGQHRIPYELKRARRRSIGFVVGPQGLRVSAPRWVPLQEIERALHHKGEWILRKLVEQRERQRRVQAARIEWVDGGQLPFLGERLTLVVAPAEREVRWDASTRELRLPLPAGAAAEQVRDLAQAWLKARAREDFLPRCQQFAARLGVTMTSLRLSSAQTRWGSASADGSIRLNWRLIHFAPAIIDYVVAHELAHLREMNHSPAFWDTVRSVLPDYERSRDALREESIVLQ